MAEEQEPFSDDLEVEETGDALEELAVDSDEVKLAKTVLINLMLLRVINTILQVLQSSLMMRKTFLEEY